METQESFEIKLPQFEGPFDLLLFFIERDELDIHDISITNITNDFLDYLHQMSALNMEVASEFIFVAATLMRIKAKMLLPRYEADAEGNEVDLKEELIRKLVEYKKIKQACEELRPYEEERMKQEKRGNIKYDLEQVEKVSTPGEELSSVTLYKLMLTYERLNKRWLTRTEEVTHTVVQYPYTIERQKKAIADLLSINSRLDFKSIAGNSENKVHFVYNFLAVLEMLQQELLNIQIGLGFNNFWVEMRGK
ncbi:segregation and condensation protein A [Mucilaginibacter myungsuensis]|uniref:Segregation and condensation protein A n=1 Tax=Mucilaginibacter myungsuensis TaxID=649104 RepID=A0A929PZ02_9SPHI|nr:segregation/condensation protein A [Mucilaginibacter myungsuensis]MBE9663995.1 segregation/condensation protein A [Mucilaginibacter myungsuensis]MDN3601174.1 segregation/condensation protein A [Mucilaginibacter myungsuensis]